MRLIAVVAATAMLVSAGAASACAFDGMPGYSHYAPDGTDPYAGAYAEAAARIAEQRRQEAIETARLAMMKRLGLKDDVATAQAPAGALAVANVRP
ncbi:hypothetical protein [Sandarakinorhabdus sp.]|uniref:hypothetical protein n=1 Tax=Sandarakinorhabdus sp. TaxID=1916663 RepID=UPI00286E64DF|nr:hypothetical protein [Sandarakinorhabdus sp.]